jgi:Zn-dependent metalloprotease
VKQSIKNIFYIVILFLSLNSSAAINDQYATEVIDFSSQYSASSWSADQILGPPNTFNYGDFSTSWGAASKNGSLEFIIVGFTTPIFATGATIRETYGNGFVYRIDAIQKNKKTNMVWKGTDSSQPSTISEFKPTWPQTDYLVTGLKIYVDTNHNLSAWEEIDSILLHGTTTTLAKISGEGGNGNIGYKFGEDGAPPLKVSCDENILKNDIVTVQDGSKGEGELGNIEIDCENKVSKNKQANNVFFAATETIEMIKKWFPGEAYSFPPYTAIIDLPIINEGDVNARAKGENMSTYTKGNSDYYPYTTIEIVAHEIGHNLTIQNGNKLIVGDDASALKEAFADITAMAAIAYISDNHNWWYEEKDDNNAKWSILDNVNHLDNELTEENDISINWLGDKDTIPKHKNIKDIYDVDNENHSCESQSESECKNTYQRQRSTIFSVPFYKLAVTQKWGFEKAYSTYLHALRKYFPQIGADFAAAKCDVMKAADDLGYDTEDVYKAFKYTNLFKKKYQHAMTECRLISMYDISKMERPEALAKNESGSIVKLEWSPLRDVHTYFINIKYNNNAWTDRTTWRAHGDETSYTFTGLNAGKRAYRIEACDASWHCTDVSDESDVVTTD